MAGSENPQEPKSSASLPDHTFTEQFLYLPEREGISRLPEHPLLALKQDPRGPEATYAEGEGKGGTHNSYGSDRQAIWSPIVIKEGDPTRLGCL